MVTLASALGRGPTPVLAGRCPNGHPPPTAGPPPRFCRTCGAALVPEPSDDALADRTLVGNSWGSVSAGPAAGWEPVAGSEPAAHGSLNRDPLAEDPLATGPDPLAKDPDPLGWPAEIGAPRQHRRRAARAAVAAVGVLALLVGAVVLHGRLSHPASSSAAARGAHRHGAASTAAPGPGAARSASRSAQASRSARSGVAGSPGASASSGGHPTGSSVVATPAAKGAGSGTAGAAQAGGAGLPAGPPGSGVAGQQALAVADQVLTPSASIRSELEQAITQVENGCTMGDAASISAAASQISTLAQQRQFLATTLAQLPMSALANSATLRSDLAGVLTISGQSDSNYQQWAVDMASAVGTNEGCPGFGSDPYWSAAELSGGTDDQSTAAKTQFIQDWDAATAGLGIPQFTADEI